MKLFVIKIQLRNLLAEETGKQGMVEQEILKQQMLKHKWWCHCHFLTADFLLKEEYSLFAVL